MPLLPFAAFVLLTACEAGGTTIGFGVGSGGYGRGGGVGLAFPTGNYYGAMQPSVDDRRVVDVTLQHALEFKPTGEAAAWSNPDTGSAGSITPTRTYQNANGQTCREFQQVTAPSGGATQQSQDRACRDAAGVWQVDAG